MRNLIGLVLALVLAACGGGGGPGDSSAPPAAPAIRFEAAYELDTTPKLLIRPVVGSSSIGTNAIARVDVLVNDRVALSVPGSSNDDSGQYVFDIPIDQTVAQGGRICTADLPLRITVADVTGFTFTKYIAVCPSGPGTFTAFSDYGEHDVRITASSSAPMNASAYRIQEVGDYADNILRKLVTSVDTVLRSSEHDSLNVRIGPFTVDNLGAPVVPDGSTATARIDAGGGAFAEAASISAADVPAFAQASLACCHAPADGSAKQVRIIITGDRSGSPATFAATWRIIDPATGTVLSQESANRVGVPSSSVGDTLAKLEQVLDVRSGQQVDVTAATDDPRTHLEVTVLAGATTGLVLGSVDSNRQARVSVFCCSLYQSPGVR